MFRKLLCAGAVLATSLVWASPARADFVSFDPDGAGPLAPITIDLFDAAPGNVLSVDGGSPAVGDSVEVLFQANLAGADNTALPGTSYANGGGGVYYTIVAGIPETVTSISNTANNSTVTFDIAGATPALPTATNYFYIYATTDPNQVLNNDLDGGCFTCGTLVLSGVFINDPAFANSFTVDFAASGVPLDQHGINNYVGTTTVAGTGGLTAQIQVTSVNPLYFPALPGGATIQLVDAQSQNNVPFTNAGTDPSACFTLTGTVGTQCNYFGAGSANIGPVNGEGKDIQLQSDASFGFQTSAVVSEPASLTLLGLGLAGAVARRRRARKIAA